MKNILPLVFILTLPVVFGQSSESIIPKEATTVFSINNISLLKKISMDDLVQYEFMSEVQSELFDGSTAGKTLKDLGIDFDQKLNAFYGQNIDFELSGFTFGIKDKEQIFSVFDDFDKIESKIPGVEFYRSYSNYLIIKKNAGIVLRVDPNYDKVSSIADSIWMARGYGYFFGDYDVLDEDIDEDYDESEILYEKSIPRMSVEEVDSLEEADIEGEMDDDDILSKNYWEMRDSITVELQGIYLQAIANDLFVNQLDLKSQYPKFAEQVSHNSDGIFYLDNSRNLQNARGLWQFQNLFPELFKDVKDLYTGNIMVGDINLKESSIDIDFVANYGEKLGTIYESLNGTKFDKKVLKYIPNDATGFFTYNINLKEGYRKAYDVIIPILSEEKDPRIAGNVLIAELINEFVDVDAVFDAYKGSMFGSFNGYKRVKTKRIEFSFDEETFEYEEKEIDGEEDMPVVTLGFSTNKNDIPEKILNHFAKLTSRFQKKNGYWMIEDAVLNSIPLYIVNKGGLFIMTNDEDLAIKYNNGYGSKSLSGKAAKKAIKSKFAYAYFDLDGALSRLPKEMLTDRQVEVIETLKGKTGMVELTSSKTTKENTKFRIVYDYEATSENAGKYLLDLVNSVYILMK